jgi:ABC-type polysaccharide/polyol phosphate transport system ATPase subunit
VGAAVEFVDVSKRYLRGGPRYQSLRSELASAVGRTLRRGRGGALSPRGKLALDGVSFRVEEGESFALVGPNGAGKSTALKLISRISYPTGGRVEVNGRVGALIEVGAGVHPELTGRENIWLYGQILGMTKAEIRRRFDEIVDFADLADALDTQVKMYSSGMQLRLGFSVASHLDPRVFVVDEALTVGDAGFQAKCVERMSKLVREGRTLLFVSHDLQAVEALCDRAVFLLDGRVAHEGSAKDVLRRYFQWTEAQRDRMLDDPGPGSGLRVVKATCHGADGAERYAYEVGEPLELRLLFRADAPLERPHLNVGISDGRSGLLVQASMLHDGEAPRRVGLEWEARCRIDHLPLRPRLYAVHCDVYGPQGHGTLMEWSQVTSFRIEGEMGAGPLALSDRTTSGPVHAPYRWELRGDVER